MLALIAVAVYLGYALHDLREPFAYGHARWADAYTYWFARAHIDFGLGTTHGLNVEGVTQSGEPIYYLSALPLVGLAQAAVVALLGGEFWAVRLLPLASTLLLLGLIAVFCHRHFGTRSAPLAMLLFLGMPFVIEYGASNAGRPILTAAFGLAGYLAYSRFLETGRRPPLVLAAVIFASGMFFGWHAGFMALAMLAHLWLRPLDLRSKLWATLVVGAALGVVVLAVLIQQGMATGDFLYPLRRALERGSAAQTPGSAISWAALFKLQAFRYWNYFGPVVTALSAYWLLRRLLPRPGWQAADTWAVLAWAPGLVLGFLLRDAAYKHDFLMLSFLPGAVLIAVLGLLRLLEDIGHAMAARPQLRWGAGLAAALLLGIHAAGAVRSAQSFERQEREDLSRGAARLAPYLKTLPAEAIVAADWSVSMASRVDGRTRERYVSLQPFIDYQTRRPVRVLADLAELQAFLCRAGQAGQPLILLQARKDELGERVRIVDGVAVRKLTVPAAWIGQRQNFDNMTVLYMKALPALQCGPAPGS